MECNIEETDGQIVESSSREIVIRAPVKNEKEWQDWLQDFQLKPNWAIRSAHAAERHSGRIVSVNIRTLTKLSTVANGTRIQSVRRNYQLRLNR
jgi:hypothetical protein